jgi:hypothetical protein
MLNKSKYRRNTPQQSTLRTIELGSLLGKLDGCEEGSVDGILEGSDEGWLLGKLEG